MKMKKRIAAWIILFIMIFVGCTAQPSDAPEDQLAFPGTKWNMTPEELIDSLDLAEDAYEISQEDNFYSIVVRNLPIFGTAADTGFEFLVSEDGQVGGLYHIQINFSEETDMEAVLAEMTKLYGEPEPADEEYSEEYNAHVRHWSSALRQSDALTAEEYEAFASAYQAQTGQELASDDTLNTDSLANIWWTDDSSQRYGTLPFEVWPRMVELQSALADVQAAYEKICD